STNQKQIIIVIENGKWRRMAVVPLTMQKPQEKVDKQLTNKLKREITAIMNWAVEGYLKWQEYGLSEPQVIKDQRRTYRTEMDSIEAFIEECCDVGDNFRIRGSELFEEYDYWAKENNQYRMTNTKFGREISKKFNKLLSGGVWYTGLKMNENEKKPVFKMKY